MDKSIYTKFPSIEFILKYVLWWVLLAGTPVVIISLGLGTYRLVNPPVPTPTYIDTCPFLRGGGE